MASGSNPDNHLFLYGSWAEKDFYKARRDGCGVSHQCFFFVAFQAILGPLSGPLDKDILWVEVAAYSWGTQEGHKGETVKSAQGDQRNHPQEGVNKHLPPFPLDISSNTPVPYKTWRPLLYLSLSIDCVPLCHCFSKVRFLNGKSMDRASEFWEPLN